LDLVLQCGANIPNELGHLAVAFRRVVAFNVDLPKRFAESIVDYVDAALPAIALRLHVVQRFRIEVELRFIERLGQYICVAADEPSGEPFLPGTERHGLKELGLALNRGRLADYHRIYLIESTIVERPVPFELRREHREFGARHRVVVELGFAALLGWP